jgi:hypothetical protein
VKRSVSGISFAPIESNMNGRRRRRRRRRRLLNVGKLITQVSHLQRTIKIQAYITCPRSDERQGIESNS